MSEAPEIARKVDFARLIGRAPSYVTKLGQTGRLVLTPDGKVRVRETLALMEATRGARDDVAARHAAQRGGEGRGATLLSGNATAGSGDAQDLAVTLREQRAAAELRRTRALAEQEEMAAAKMRRELIEIAVVDAAMKAVGATVRSLSEQRADQLAPLVVHMTNLDEVHAAIQEYSRNELERFGMALSQQNEDLQKGLA